MKITLLSNQEYTLLKASLQTCFKYGCFGKFENHSSQETKYGKWSNTFDYGRTNNVIMINNIIWYVDKDNTSEEQIALYEESNNTYKSSC